MVSKVAFGPSLNFQPLGRKILYVLRAWSLTNAHTGLTRPISCQNSPGRTMEWYRWRLRSNEDPYSPRVARCASKLGAATPERTALRRIEQNFVH